MNAVEAHEGKPRRVVLSARMHAALLDVLEFACGEHPGDIDARRLRNIVKAAKRIDASDDEVDADVVPRRTGRTRVSSGEVGTLLEELRTLEADARRLGGVPCER